MAILDLEALPRSNDDHVWADYVELLCLANLDGRMSRADVLDRVLNRLAIDRAGEDAPLPNRGDTTADRYDARIADAFRQLQYRTSQFGRAYGFRVERRSVLVRRPMTQRRRMYAFMLIASNLRYLEQASHSRITKEFERFAFTAVRAWLPPPAEVHLFGTTAPAASRYSGPKMRRLERLAADLGEILQPDIELRQGDVGDAGADIIGWFPLGDRNRSAMAFLAQATCLADWQDHQHHASNETWRQVIPFKTATTNVLLIPQCFRKADGSWAFSQQIANSVLIDRVRLAFLLEAMPPTWGAYARETLHSALAYREEVV